MLCMYFRIPFQLLPLYLHNLSICFCFSSSLLVFHLSYEEGPLSWHLLLTSPRWNILWTFIFNSLLWRASVIAMMSNYFLCPWLSTKTSWSRDPPLSLYFPLSTVKLCWLTLVTDQVWYVLFIYSLRICLYACLFICWNLNAVRRHSKVYKQSLGLMVEDEAISE